MVANCMVAIVAAACLGCAARGLPGPPPPHAGSSLSSPIPTGAAVIAHEEGGARLYIVDLRSSQLQPISPEGETPHQPIWSPDGRRLAYRIYDRLYVHTDEAANDAVLSGIEIETNRSCAFSPDGRQLAVVSHGAVDVWFTDRLGAAVGPLSYPAPHVGDLLWSRDGKTLVALISPSASSEMAQIIRIVIQDRSVANESVTGVSRLLGWRPNQELVVVRTTPRGEEPEVVLRSGLSPLGAADEEQFVLDYSAGLDRLLFAQGGEDTGDDVILRLGRPGGAPLARWLGGHPQLSDLHLSVDGRWALFVDRSVGSTGREGGSVFVVPVGSEHTKLVLAAILDALFRFEWNGAEFKTARQGLPKSEFESVSVSVSWDLEKCHHWGRWVHHHRNHRYPGPSR